MSLRTVSAPAPARSDRYTFLQGRAWALDMASSLSGAQVPLLLERMARAVAGMPASYAAGVQSVVEALKGVNQ